MDDKRIKLITIEMFIAWGMICWIFLLIDMEFWHLGSSVLYTSHAFTQHTIYSGIAWTAINLSCAASTLIVRILSEYIPKGTYLLFVITALQILIYWYLGKLLGDFIIGEKHSRKTSSESTVSSEHND